MTGVPAPRSLADENLLSSASLSLLTGSLGGYGVIVADAQGRIVSWNQAARDLLGSQLEIMGPSIDQLRLVHPGTGHLSQVINSASSLGTKELECEGVRSDGTAFWAATSVSPLTDPRGDRIGTVIVVRDITASIRENQARQLELRLSTETIDSLPGIFYMYDAQGRFLRWNKEFESVSGYSPDEIRNSHPLDFFLEKDHPLLAAKIQSVFANGFDEVEADFLSKDGTTRPYYFNGVRFEVDGDTRLMGVGFDISTRRQAESKLKDSEQRLRLALAAAQMGIFDWELDTNKITWTRRHEELWGYQPGEFTGTYESFASRVHPDDLRMINAELERCIDARNSYSCEYRVCWPDGSLHWVAGSGEFEYDASGAPRRMRGVVMEVTARKLLEQKYMHAQKMESIGQLAGGVAHDFNNLLTVIKGHSELALATAPLDSGLRSALVDILDAARRAAELTRQLLAFGRRSLANPVLLNLNDVILDSRNLLRRLIGEDITLSLQLCPSVKLVRVDPSQIGQLLMNLAVNARDALEGSGQISIRSESIEVTDNDGQEYPALPSGDYTLLTFSDDGPGIAPEYLDKVFEPFFTTKEVGKGTGLGLSVVYGIVTQSGGHVTVNSGDGGTTFKIYLPAVT